MIKPMHKLEKGFTLIELLLAMAFLTFMLLFVVTALTQLIGSYNKGLVYKGINQAGRTVLEEMSRSIRSGTPTSTVVSVMGQGRLCTGGKAYIWNADNTTQVNGYDASTPITGIVRLDDLKKEYCTTKASAPIPRSSATILVDNTVKVRNFGIIQAYGGKLSLFDMQLSTSDTDDFETALSPEGDFICKGGRAGEFCAVVRIRTAVSVRNLGG